MTRRFALILGLILFGCMVLPPATAKAAVLSGSISLVTPDPALGVEVSFEWNCSGCPNGPPKSQPRIQVLCYQGALLVYGEAGPADQGFLLGGGSSDWLNGTNGADPFSPAHCVATLYFWSYRGVQQFNFVTQTEFTAAGR